MRKPPSWQIEERGWFGWAWIRKELLGVSRLMAQGGVPKKLGLVLRTQPVFTIFLLENHDEAFLA